MRFSGYVGARSCTGGPQPGARALMSWFLGAYAARGARNDGIYNCRNQRGAKVLSIHCEGRAADLGCKAGDSWAQALANLLVAKSKELGVQCVIYNRRIWSGAYPSAGWRPYHGTDPHTTHLHVELSWASARSLTVARIKSVLTPADKYRYPGHMIGVGSGDKTAVKRLQTALGFAKKDIDGIFGKKTQKAVADYQRDKGLHVDGVVGPKTWSRIF
jgi:hypothetical protein